MHDSDALGVTDYYIGKTLNIPSASLSNWKQGKRGLGKENLRKIASFFDVPLEQLTGEAPLDESAVMSVRSMAERYAVVSDEALEIAMLYDRTDHKNRQLIRIILDYPTAKAC